MPLVLPSKEVTNMVKLAKQTQQLLTFWSWWRRLCCATCLHSGYRSITGFIGRIDTKVIFRWLTQLVHFVRLTSALVYRLEAVTNSQQVLACQWSAWVHLEVITRLFSYRPVYQARTSITVRWVYPVPSSAACYVKIAGNIISYRLRAWYRADMKTVVW